MLHLLEKAEVRNQKVKIEEMLDADEGIKCIV